MNPPSTARRTFGGDFWVADRTPALSLVVVIFNMKREAPRTLYSLSAAYQQRIPADAYEVVVVDNGSSEPLGRDELSRLQGNFRYFYLDGAARSPAGAVNFGVRQSRGAYLGTMIDGARILTPGTLATALECLGSFPRLVVGTLAFHLGPDLHVRACRNGYDRATEDRLLGSIRWPEDGYRLFDVAVLAASSDAGWLRPLVESNCLFLRKELFWELGGFAEDFDAPGGGFVNLDFWRRACELPAAALVHLLGEASFHQYHGGAATGRTEAELANLFIEWSAQYRRIRGREFSPPTRQPRLYGELHRAMWPWLERSSRLAGVPVSEALEAFWWRPSGRPPWPSPAWDDAYGAHQTSIGFAAPRSTARTGRSSTGPDANALS